MDLPVFKIRASAAHEILGGTIGLTESQEEKLNDFLLRQKGTHPKGLKLTSNMEDELNRLIYLKDNPELPQGAKTYCEKWLKEKLYERRKNFQNKYLEKGISCEELSIVFASEYFGWPDASKNEEWFDDEFFEGTPDIIVELEQGPTVIDMKNVWDCFTLPLFEKEIPNPGYATQLQVYMHLVSKGYHVDFNHAILCYSLMSAPIEVKEREMKRLSWEQGLQGFISDEIRQKVHREMDYNDFSPELRLKLFEVKRDKSVIDDLIVRVEMCRQYITNTLLSNLIFKSKKAA